MPIRCSYLFRMLFDIVCVCVCDVQDFITYFALFLVFVISIFI